jgi:ATP-dependent DNA helicase RecQ
MQKMIDYISEEDTCRSAYLLEYFGQSESADCGTCDICRADKSKSAGPVEAADRLSTFINHEKSGVYVLEDIPMELIPVLHRLIDEGTVPPPQIA